MKRWMALLSAAVMLLMTVSAHAATLATSSTDSLQVQDIYDFARTELSYSGGETNSDGQWNRSFKGDRQTVIDVVDRYVNLLTGELGLFQVGHTYRQENKKQLYWSVVLSYTGSGGLQRDTVGLMFDDKYKGDLMVYYMTDGSRMKGKVVAAKGLEVLDLGYRSDGTRVTLEQPGASAEAGLVENADGSYSTSDGRLTAAPGEAAVLRDGELYKTGEISLIRNRSSEREEILISNYYRNEGIAMTFPYNLLMTGDSFGLKQMGQTTFQDNYENTMQGFFTKRMSYIFGICHSGDYLYAHPDPSTGIQSLLIRVMLWDTQRQLGVFYIACTFDSAPFTVETLAAFYLDAAASYTGNADRVTMHVGDALTFSFDDRQYMPSYELYQWEIVEGSTCVELSGNRSQSCQVKATWKGQARIRVTYTYGATESDVLTYRPRHVEKVITKEYLIDIVE